MTFSASPRHVLTRDTECQRTPLSGERYDAARNDIWSLGVILVNLACGRNPWKKACTSDPTFRAFTQDPKFLTSILPISAELEMILRVVFNLDPERRVSLAGLRRMIENCQRFTAGPGPRSPVTPPPEKSFASAPQQAFLAPSSNFSLAARRSNNPPAPIHSNTEHMIMPGQISPLATPSPANSDDESERQRKIARPVPKVYQTFHSRTRPATRFAHRGQVVVA